MTDEMRRHLEARREELIAKATRRILAENGPQDIQAEIAQIEACSKLLSAAGPKETHDRAWAFVVAVACVAVAGMLWSFKVPHTDVSASVDTESFRATLAKPWRIDNAFHSARVHAERLSSIEAPNLGLSINQASGDAWFALEGGQIALQTLETGTGASVEVLSDEDEVDIFVGLQPLVGKVTVTGKVRVTAGPRSGEISVNQIHEVEIPETLEFSVQDPKGVPSQFSIHSPGKWSLGRPQISAVSFTREEVREAGERVLTSGIKSGTVRFNDTAWTVLELREGDLLSLHSTEAAAIEARGEAGLIHVTLGGTVGSITVGDLQSPKQLAPSYLEYFYNKKSLGFFWSAIGFFWGFIWSVRRAMSH
ncbi:MAG TPA: hypothetical protein VG759_00015 [Candidatus Angelobacter sp.]|jgi:hypothetical protein|nr:hypothetical protein [Candidatus Angelobacter sp.]